jgi:anti-anti-sigma factor
MPKAVHVVMAPAEIDPSSVRILAGDLADIPDQDVVAVDCSQVSFMDSAGVRALSMAAQRHEAAGGALSVVRPTAVVRRILEVTSLDSLIDDGGTSPAEPEASR